MRVPKEVYQSSPRKFDSAPPELNYPGSYAVRKISRHGTVKLNSQCINVTTALRGYEIGLEPRQVGQPVRHRQRLDGVELELPLAGRTAIVGPNGSGKTTLLHAIHGLVRTQRGTIDAADAHGAPLAPRLALVLQRPVMLRRSALANVKSRLVSTCICVMPGRSYSIGSSTVLMLVSPLSSSRIME